MAIQNSSHRACNTQIVGVQGCGKSTLLSKLARKSNARYRFVFDYKLGDLAKMLGRDGARDGAEMVASLIRGGWCVMAREHFFEGEAFRAFDLFTDFVRSQIGVLHGVKLLVADELQDYTFTNDAKKPLDLLRICDMGRSLQTDVLIACQAWNRVHWGVRNQATMVYAFRQISKNAVEPLVEVGFDKNEVQTLKNGEYVWRNLATGEAGRGGKAF